ncbi:hypothetical protein MAGR_36370 [Mycolicibacterium agri]|uniref:Uncharacterized protein n=1 Tax=Mycolicibacterium agri TaxID=36811 RepID=A0A7I9W4U3_MYCAG|nr:hypothetical protein MAGR_36370 [Mycolicibacterium agri]
MALTATAHHEQLRRDERIGYHALYGEDGEIPGQLSIDNLQPGADVGAEGQVSAYSTAAITLGIHPDAVRA